MTRPAWLVLASLLVAPAASAADDQDLLVARLLYNQRQFDAAIEAANAARGAPGLADRADLIAARAYLERYRATASPDDLAAARERLRRIYPDRLRERERGEYLVGLGETLYFDEAAGAAAGVFDSVLTGAHLLTPDERERILDWWASALDRDARQRADLERPLVYRTVRERMQAELGANPTSATASYWLSAAAWGLGDHQAAWDAAQAAWVRAPLASDRGAALRGDLDRLMRRAIIPDRARALARAASSLEEEWDSFKQKWSR